MTKIIDQLKNDDGETYCVKIATDNPSRFLRGLWEAIDPSNKAQDDEWFCQELTDRMRCFRTISRQDSVVIYTHGFTPEGDTREINVDVLLYLKSQGIEL